MLVVQNFSRTPDYINLLFLVGGRQDIGVSSIGNAHNRAVEELSAGSSHSRVVTGIVVDLGLGQHGHVFNLGLSKVRAVGGDEDHLGLALSKSLHGVLVTQNGLTRLHDQLETTVHRVLGLFLHSAGGEKPLVRRRRGPKT